MISFWPGYLSIGMLHFMYSEISPWRKHLPAGDDFSKRLFSVTFFVTGQGLGSNPDSQNNIYRYLAFGFLSLLIISS